MSKEQFESLENIARALLQKLERVEERLNALEGAPAQREEPATVVSFPVIAVSEPAAPTTPEIASEAEPEPVKAAAPTPKPAAPIPTKVESVRKRTLFQNVEVHER